MKLSQRRFAVYTARDRRSQMKRRCGGNMATHPPRPPPWPRLAYMGSSVVITQYDVCNVTADAGPRTLFHAINNFLHLRATRAFVSSVPYCGRINVSSFPLLINTSISLITRLYIYYCAIRQHGTQIQSIKNTTRILTVLKLRQGRNVNV